MTTALLKDRAVLRSLCLMAIALGFGIQARRYAMGSLAAAGPGFFPLMVSCFLFLIALAMMVQAISARAAVAPVFQVRNVGLIVLGLTAFTFISQNLNMVAGIVAMVACAALAGSSSFSWLRNVQVAVGLVVLAFAFERLFGLGLHLY